MAEDKVTVYKDENEEWRWRRRAANGEIIATSGEGYVDMTHAIDMAIRVNRDAAVSLDKSATEVE